MQHQQQQQQLTGNKLTHSIAVQSILEYASAVYSQEQFSSSSKLTQYCSLDLEQYSLVQQQQLTGSPLTHSIAVWSIPKYFIVFQCSLQSRATAAS